MKTAEILSVLIVRELRTVRREIEAYPDDESLWACPAGISNSGGVLAHHCAGNLRHYIGTRLGSGSYVRDRAAEFARTDLSRDELTRLIDAAIVEVEGTLLALSDDVLGRDYPDAVAGHRIGTTEMLTHLLSHLAYHLGQIDYHRRLVTGSGETVSAAAFAEAPGVRPDA